jgi:hypothetical protein
MKVFMLITGNGPLVILTSFAAATDAGLVQKLEVKGITKFICYELPIEMAKERYGAHFAVVEHDLHETDDLRVLDYNGDRAFKLFSFAELGTPITYEKT